MGIFCMSQGTQAEALYQPRRVGWGGRLEGERSRARDILYTYGLFMLRIDRKQQNSVKQLSFNQNINFSKVKKVNNYYQFFV